MPQGSVLGPILFVLYTVDLLRVIDNYGLSPHMYADDTQVYGFCRPTAATTLTANITDCVEAATSWMRSNRLQPNSDKTEFLWCATVRRQRQLPITSPLLIDGCSITTVQSARDLGIYVDCDLSMRTHVQRTVSRCFIALYRRPHSRRWWSLWSTPDWTTEIANGLELTHHVSRKADQHAVSIVQPGVHQCDH